MNLPLIEESEYGGVYWLEGHVDPAVAVVAMIGWTMINVGAEDAMHIAVGGPRTAWRTSAPVWTEENQWGHLGELFELVDHVWLLEHEDDDIADVVPAGTPGGAPWTRINLN